MRSLEWPRPWLQRKFSLCSRSTLYCTAGGWCYCYRRKLNGMRRPPSLTGELIEADNPGAHRRRDSTVLGLYCDCRPKPDRAVRRIPKLGQSVFCSDLCYNQSRRFYLTSARLHDKSPVLSRISIRNRISERPVSCKFLKLIA